jgi:hypothetical protein
MRARRVYHRSSLAGRQPHFRSGRSRRFSIFDALGWPHYRDTPNVCVIEVLGPAGTRPYVLFAFSSVPKFPTESDGQELVGVNGVLAAQVMVPAPESSVACALFQKTGPKAR